MTVKHCLFSMAFRVVSFVIVPCNTFSEGTAAKVVIYDPVASLHVRHYTPAANGAGRVRALVDHFQEPILLDGNFNAHHQRMMMFKGGN